MSQTSAPCVIGIDPDLHQTSFALVSSDRQLRAVAVASVRSSISGPEAVTEMIEAMRALIPDWSERRPSPVLAVIESQRVYTGSKADPDDLIRLAQVAGAAAMLSRALWGCAVRMPYPAEWKGQVPKHVHQGRTLKALGIDYKQSGKGTGAFCVPTRLPSFLSVEQELKPASWKHLVDAAGLALYGVKALR